MRTPAIYPAIKIVFIYADGLRSTTGSSMLDADYRAKTRRRFSTRREQTLMTAEIRTSRTACITSDEVLWHHLAFSAHESL
jgi:hypothetical protein